MHTAYQAPNWPPATPPARRNRAGFITTTAIVLTVIAVGVVAVWHMLAPSPSTPPSWVANPPKARPVVVSDLPGTLAAFDPAGNVVTIDGDGIHFFNPETTDEVRASIAHDDADRIEFTSDGSLLAVMCACDGDGGVVDIIETATGEKICRVTDPQMTSSMRFSPNGRVLATGSDELAQWWNTETCGSEGTVGFRGQSTSPVTFDRYGTFAAASPDGRVGMWSEQLYGDEAVVIYTDGAVNDIQYGPKGLLATAGIAGNVQLWSALTGEGGFIPFDAAAEVWDLDFSSDGELLASLSDRVRLWDIGSAQLETDDPFDGRDVDGGVAGQLVLFSPDGSTIATTCGDGTLLADVRV